MAFGKGGGGSGGGARDWGLLFLRVGIGLSFIVIHGGPKVLAGKVAWAGLGKTVLPLLGGVQIDPVALGAIAAFTELIGGVLIILGLFFRPACAAVAMVMIFASCAHLVLGMGAKPDAELLGRLSVGSHALEMAVLFVSLTLIGAGRFSLGRHVPGPTIRMEKDSE